jgi:tetratricopeptide (TPR) repeat protein
MLTRIARKLLGRWVRNDGKGDMQGTLKDQSAVDENLTSLLNNLTVIVSDQYKRTGRMNDLEEAIQTARRAVDITPEDHPVLAGWLNNLDISLSDRYKRTGLMEDLEEAIQTAQRAVEITPEDHPVLAVWLYNLALILSARYAQAREQKDKRASIDNHLKAYRCQNAVPQTRIRAARGAINLLLEDGDNHQAPLYAKEALRLLPLVCGRSLSRKDQQHAVTQTAGLAAEACSLLLRTRGNPADGVDYLEQGRGIVIGYLIDGCGTFRTWKANIQI